MFYKPDDGHGLPHNPFGAIISPRPIAWISTRSSEGVDNLAPYSFFNAVAYEPPQIMFASVAAKEDQPKGKDTVANILQREVFCVNIVSYEQRHVMNATAASFARGVDEFEEAGIEKAECETIACARVANGPASLECELVRTIDLPGESNIVVFGKVRGIHLRDDYLVDGIFDVTKYRPLTRLGYRDYSSVDTLFTLIRPK